MGLRKEVREFMAETRLWMKSVSVGNKVYVDIIEKQNVEKEKLLDRCLARDLPELKSYVSLDGMYPKEEEYNPLEDEDLAGQDVRIGE